MTATGRWREVTVRVIEIDISESDRVRRQLVGPVNAGGPCIKEVGSRLEAQDTPQDGPSPVAIPAAHRIGTPARWYSEFRSRAADNRAAAPRSRPSGTAQNQRLALELLGQLECPTRPPSHAALPTFVSPGVSNATAAPPTMRFAKRAVKSAHFDRSKRRPHCSGPSPAIAS